MKEERKYKPSQKTLDKWTWLNEEYMQSETDSPLMPSTKDDTHYKAYEDCHWCDQFKEHDFYYCLHCGRMVKDV